MKPSKGGPTKRASSAALRGARETVRKQKVVLTMPIPRAPEPDKLVERIEAHREKMGSLEDAYRECMQDIFGEPVSLAKKRALIKKNVRLFSAALLDWQISALELASESQAVAWLQMLPDPKGGRWLN